MYVGECAWPCKAAEAEARKMMLPVRAAKYSDHCCADIEKFCAESNEIYAGMISILNENQDHEILEQPEDLEWWIWKATECPPGGLVTGCRLN